ncbi:lipocalin-like domain-containing protein [Mycobacterium sp. Aquia_216]|uniref:lipocalin-like domain-containing protein n=1 Tax=Mycobacterium sp. Aquia_216 TaxID=2991729 RepID=UPI00227D0D3E|nr:lipocalin-like domain-containing protein [Mycobacterium sp. Aquia_216]WAJ43719.1 lipocalin-like domain-containing protein [Mycobacterium sp. Aquia_216]
MTLHDDIRGSWALVSYTTEDERGGPVSYPLGPDALGLIMYTHDGYMSAQLMRPDRPDYEQPDTAGGTEAQHAAAAAGYLAYSGPYAVDEATGIVHHEVVVSLLPNWLGTLQLRHSILESNRLTLIAEAPSHGRMIRSTLVWARPVERDR